MLDELKQLCIATGEMLASMQEGISSRAKSDGSPVTEADLKANAMIVAALTRLDPGTPVLAEESAIPPYESRRQWKRFWLVDPLDGTREYVTGSPDYSVNIALIEDGRATLGLTGVPGHGRLYWASENQGAWRQTAGGSPERIYSRPPPTGQALRIVESRSHRSPELERYLAGLNIAERRPAGSAYKFCLVAEGSADLYPRFGTTMEWDVAAGDCIYRNSSPGAPYPSLFRFNKPDLRNGDFVIGLGERTQSAK